MSRDSAPIDFLAKRAKRCNQVQVECAAALILVELSSIAFTEFAVCCGRASCAALNHGRFRREQTPPANQTFNAHHHLPTACLARYRVKAPSLGMHRFTYLGKTIVHRPKTRASPVCEEMDPGVRIVSVGLPNDSLIQASWKVHLGGRTFLSSLL